MTTTPIRLLTVLPLVLAPAVMGAALLTDITPQAADTKELLELIARDPGAWSMGQTLFFLSALLWVPAGLLLRRLFGREQRLGRAAGVAVTVGGLAVLPVDAAGLYLRELAASDIPIDQQVQLVEGVESSPAVLLFETVHIAGLFLGLLVVGAAMLRHPALPRAAGALVLTGTIALVAAPAGPLLAGATALLVAGFAITALRISRQAHYGLIEHPHARDNASTTTEGSMRSGSNQPIDR
ncbi:MAG: hypothetical protein WBL35_05845 [Ornithinibacter sp.]